MKWSKKLTMGIVLAIMFCGAAYATPSTLIWIPSTDIQPYKKVHLGADTYIKTKGHNGVTEPTVTNLGLTVGVLPWEKFQMEVGIDYRDIGGNHAYPMYCNAKLGIPEGAIFRNSPAIAVGGYDFGTEKNVSDYNIVYASAAKTFGKFGRLSAGYYRGNDRLFLDINGNNDNSGVLLAWDRSISEISDKLWLGVDYQGGKNTYGALSFGMAWKFAPEIGMIFGYDVYNESFYKPTATIQIDIDY